MCRNDRPTTIMKQWLLILVLALFSNLVTAAESDQVVIGEFSSGKLDGWETKVFENRTRYQLTQLDNTQVLRADSQTSASGLVRKIRIDLQKYPFLNWRWRIENRLGKLDEQSKSGDDYAARVYVIVDGGLFFWNTKAINYVWANRSPKGHVWPNAFGGRNAMMMALRSGEDRTDAWYVEKRNILQDFNKLFGKEIRYIDAVALMTDTDNSKGEVTSFYGDIYFSVK